MLARFAAALQRGQLAGIAQGGIPGITTGEGGAVVIDDNCTVQ